MLILENIVINIYFSHIAKPVTCKIYKSAKKNIENKVINYWDNIFLLAAYLL